MTGAVLDSRLDLPYLTSDLPGVGGRIKCTPTDFIVEEIPLYAPCGEGTHVYFQIEKQSLTTQTAVQRIARAVGKRPRDVGVAGLKDSAAITRQYLSIEHVDDSLIRSLAIDGISILEVTRHTNKLKRGHLQGNRFMLRIRGVSDDAPQRVPAILAVIERRGLANYFGPQRFGNRGDNGAIGLAVLRGDFQDAIAILLGRPDERDRGTVLRARELFESGDYRSAARAWPAPDRARRRACDTMARTGGDCTRAWRAIDRDMRTFYLSAGQSEMFNRVVAARIAELDCLMDGDLAIKHVNGACFSVESASVEQPRCDAFEISPTGPLFGRRMTAPTGRPARLESAVLDAHRLSQKHFAERLDVRVDGARRALRVPVGAMDFRAVHDHGVPCLDLRFELPSGSYATSLTREICKNEQVVGETRG